MKITTNAIMENGYFEDKYGRYGTQLNRNGKCTYSFPFSIEDAPEGTESFCGIFYDMDDVPASGFVWIHWTFCNLTETEVAENVSVNNPNFVQGMSTFHSIADGANDNKEEGATYGGPAPEGGDHEYTLVVFALDTKLDLEEQFYMNEMVYAMEGHVLDKAVLKGMYRE